MSVADRSRALCAAVAPASLALAAGCSKPDAGGLPVDAAFQKKLPEPLLDARPGAVVESRVGVPLIRDWSPPCPATA